MAAQTNPPTSNARGVKMNLFELDGVPHIIAKTRDEYQHLHEELLREYRSFLRFLLSHYGPVRLQFRKPLGRGIDVAYGTRAGTAKETDAFNRYLRTVRRFLRFTDGRSTLASSQVIRSRAD